MTPLALMGFLLIATLCLKPWVALTTSAPSRCVSSSLTEEDIQRGSKKKELNALRRHFIQKNGFNAIELSECECWRLYKTANSVEQHIREHFPYRQSLAAEQLLEEIKTGLLFGSVRCDIETWYLNLITLVQ